MNSSYAPDVEAALLALAVGVERRVEAALVGPVISREHEVERLARDRARSASSPVAR